MRSIAFRHGFALVSRHPESKSDRCLATPYIEVDPGVAAVLRGCLPPEDSGSAGAFGKQGVGSCRSDCLFQRCLANK